MADDGTRAAARANASHWRFDGLRESDVEGQARFAAFRQGLQQLGWTEGRNIRIDLRWGGGNVERTRGFATELVHLSPDVIFAYAVAQPSPSHADAHDSHRLRWRRLQ